MPVMNRYDWTASAGGTTTFTPYRSGAQWRKRMAQNSEVTTDMDASFSTYTPGDMVSSVITKEPDFLGQKYMYRLDGDYYGAVLGIPGDPNDLSLDEADNIARERTLQKIIAVQRKFQTGVFLGELKDTIRLITNPLGSIFEDTLKYCDRLRKRGRIYKRLKERKKLLADSWLQYSFGVLPLIGDIRNAAEAAAQIVTYRMPHENVSGRGRSTASSSHSYVDSFGPLITTIDWEQKRSAEVVYRARVLVSNDTTRDNLETLGLTWGNFVPTVWEVLPFSFLVDYFTNCGKVIDSLSVNTARLAWCNKGSKREISSRGVKIRTSVNPNVNQSTWEVGESSSGTPATNVRTILARRGGQPLPVPSLRFKLPFDGNDFANASFSHGKMRAINIAALAASQALR